MFVKFSLDIPTQISPIPGKTPTPSTKRSSPGRQRAASEEPQELDEKQSNIERIFRMRESESASSESPHVRLSISPRKQHTQHALYRTKAKASRPPQSSPYKPSPSSSCPSVCRTRSLVRAWPGVFVFFFVFFPHLSLHSFLYYVFFPSSVSAFLWC